MPGGLTFPALKFWMLIKFHFSSKTGILVVKFAFATANLKIETLRMRRRFARVLCEGLLPTIRHFENRRGEGPGDEVVVFTEVRRRLCVLSVGGGRDCSSVTEVTSKVLAEAVLIEIVTERLRVSGRGRK